MLESGVSQQAYVELVSVVTSSVIVDTMHASLGLELPALPAPAPGAPSGEFDDKTIDGGAWLPVMQAEQKMIEDVHMPTVPYIRRAMSLVPSAVRLFFQTFRPHYALIDVPLSISQAQAEFVAARVSALNECFY